MSKRKNDNTYQNDPKRFSVPLPDFSVPPPGFNSAPYNTQNYPSNWFGNPAQQQTSSFGFYNYNNNAETSNFNSASPYFWQPNKPRTFPSSPAVRPAALPNLKLRGRGGRGRAPTRGNEPYMNKSPRTSTSVSGAPPWFQGAPSLPSTSSRFPNSIFESDRSFESCNIVSEDKNESKKTIVNKKGKRKSMSQKYSSKPWDLESAEKAVAVELEYNRLQNTQSLILKFPDAELNKEIVKKFNTNIEHVHFQQPSTPRYCFVQLCEGADVDAVQNQLREVEFGGGKITVEKKINQKSKELAPEKIDPYTLYVGNLPTNITAETVKAIYPTAFRVDIGYAQKMKYTRYAFISYQSAEAAIKAFKDTHSLSLESRSIIVRFRRHKGAVGLPGQSKTPGHENVEGSKNTSNSNNELKVKNSAPSMTDDVDNGSDLHDAALELDEDDYDIPYHDDLDDHYNSDFDDSLFDDISTSNKKYNRNELQNQNKALALSNKSNDALKTNRPLVNSVNSKAKKNVTSTDEIARPKDDEAITSEIKKNVEQQIEEIIPNVITQLLNSNEIKKEPIEKEYMEQLLQNQFPDFASQITALAVGAIKKEPLVAELLFRKKHGKVPMPMMCADEIKTEPTEEPTVNNEDENSLEVANLIPKVEAMDSDDQEEYTDDLDSYNKNVKKVRESMYKRLQKFKQYRPPVENNPVNYQPPQPDQPIEDFDMSYILNYISDEQAQFEELNRETLEAANYIASRQESANETSNSLAANTQVLSETGVPDNVDKTSTFGNASPVLIRLPLSKPVDSEPNSNEKSVVESTSAENCSEKFLSPISTAGAQKSQETSFQNDTNKTPAPSLLAAADSTLSIINSKPTAAVSPLVTDVQSTSITTGKSSTSSSNRSIAQRPQQPSTSNNNSPIAAVSPFSASDTKNSSNCATVSPFQNATSQPSGSIPSSTSSTIYHHYVRKSKSDLGAKSGPKKDRRHQVLTLDRTPNLDVSQSNVKNIKITNILRNPFLPPAPKLRKSDAVSHIPYRPQGATVDRQTLDIPIKVEEEDYGDFSEDEEDTTDYVALLGAPPPNLDDYINKS